jgi:hypothetical protein
MTSAALRPADYGEIDNKALLKAELTVLWIRGRRSFLTYVAVLFGLLVVLAASVIVDMRTDPERVRDTFSFSGTNVLLLPMLLGILWALWTWRGEAPSQRGYFHSAPADRTTRNIVRAVAGWAWLMFSVALYALGCAITALAVYGTDALTRGPAITWPALFISATVVYLLSTPFTILSERPDRAILGTFLAVIGVAMLLEIAGLSAMQKIYGSVVLHLTTALNPHVRPGGAYAIVSYGAAVATWLVVGSVTVFLAARRFKDSR